MNCEDGKTFDQNGNCPICKMRLIRSESVKENDPIIDNTELPGTSIFHLTSKWNTQNKETIELEDLKGDVLVIVMIYTSCKAACPRLVADMRNIRDQVKSQTVKYVLVSIDPETDTPDRLKAFAIENQMDADQWIFLQGTPDNVRVFSNVLAVKYKQISPIDFSHSNIISVFDKDGVLFHQQEGLGVNNDLIISKIVELVR
ncbi:MAG: SCO family protein [Flavobacteriales bacterium]|nr:SCO family protein [Flavobacteriales bacterium]